MSSVTVLSCRLNMELHQKHITSLFYLYSRPVCGSRPALLLFLLLYFCYSLMCVFVSQRSRTGTGGVRCVGVVWYGEGLLQVFGKSLPLLLKSLRGRKQHQFSSTETNRDFTGTQVRHVLFTKYCTVMLYLMCYNHIYYSK